MATTLNPFAWYSAATFTMASGDEGGDVIKCTNECLLSKKSLSMYLGHLSVGSLLLAVLLPVLTSQWTPKRMEQEPGQESAVA
eukprot:1156861-Pelagomonas_calceolata.AAC.2